VGLRLGFLAAAFAAAAMFFAASAHASHAPLFMLTYSVQDPNTGDYACLDQPQYGGTVACAWSPSDNGFLTVTANQWAYLTGLPRSGCHSASVAPPDDFTICELDVAPDFVGLELPTASPDNPGDPNAPLPDEMFPSPADGDTSASYVPPDAGLSDGDFIGASGAMLGLGFALSLATLFFSAILLGFVGLVRRLLG
jgi:hypothetical protein